MKSYTLKNYKLIKEQEFDLNKINIIVGENSSGKSSFLRSFQLLKQSMYFSNGKLNTNFKDGIDFGGFFNLLPRGEEKPVTFKIIFENAIESYGEFKIEGIEWSYEDNNLTFINIFLEEDVVLEIKLESQQIKKIKFNNNLLKEFEKNKIIFSKDKCFPILEEINEEFRYNKYRHYRVMLSDEEKNDKDIFNFLLYYEDNIVLNKKLEFILKKGKEPYRKWNRKEEIQNYDLAKRILNPMNSENSIKHKIFKSNEIKFMCNTILEDVGEAVKNKIESIIYTGAIRAVGERYYRIESNYFFDYTLNNDVSRKLYQLNETNLLDKFNKFIAKYLDFKVEVKTLSSSDFKGSPEAKEIFFYIQIIKQNFSENIVDVGAGYSQILPILYACFEKGERDSSTIIIEQPELHLHPKMQSDLMDLILKLSKKNPKLQFIIETHSSLIIDRIGKNINLKNYKNSDVNIFIFNKKDKNILGCNSKIILDIKKTKYTNEGILEEWPLRFFSAKGIKKW